MKFCLLLLLFQPKILGAQLLFEELTDLGKIPPTFEIKGDILLKNNSEKKIYLLRADAEAGIKIFTSRKMLLPGDTCLLVVSFVAQQKGDFVKKINLVSSDRNEAYVLRIKGNLEQFTPDNKQACYYFGKSKSDKSKAPPAIISGTTVVSTENSNKIPDPSNSTTNNPAPKFEKEKKETSDTSNVKKSTFDADLKPNNLIFLVDISGSMKDSLKLPLMKKALHELIGELREVDKLTFITYADTIKVIAEFCGLNQTEFLHKTVNDLKAKGMTKGKKAILFSQQMAQKHFIIGGNNQIIIATDGQFKYENADHKLWKLHQENQPIILSTMMFGDEREAVRNLKEIARKCGGSFIHVKSGTNSASLLFQEIRDKSKR